MNEHEWDSERDPFVLLDFLFPMRGLDSIEQQTRQSRLYLLACARRAWDQLPGVGRVLIELVERQTERESLEPSLRHAAFALAEELTLRRGEPEEIAELEGRATSIGLRLAGNSTVIHDTETWIALAHLVYFPFAKTTPYYRRIPKNFHSVELIREVFGNPARPIHFDPDWLERNVVSLARGMHTNRDFSAMPILADALQDAGCDNPHILDHCRKPREHIRGCWVLEGILNRREKQ